MWLTFFRGAFPVIPLHLSTYVPAYSPFIREMITSRLSPTEAPNPPSSGFLPLTYFHFHPSRPPPDNLPPILSFTITFPPFSFACSTYPVIPEVFRPLSWQIMVIPDRPWGIVGVFYTLTLKSYI